MEISHKICSASAVNSLETPKLAANLSAASKAAIPTDEMMVTYIPSLND
jgi:hypothetical protein